MNLEIDDRRKRGGLGLVGVDDGSVGGLDGGLLGVDIGLRGSECDLEIGDIGPKGEIVSNAAGVIGGVRLWDMVEATAQRRG